MNISNFHDVQIVSEILNRNFTLPSYSTKAYGILANKLDDELRKLSEIATEGNHSEYGFQLDENKVVLWPFIRMGNVTSFDLLRLDELVLFHFYRRLKDRFARAIDLGSNLGLHSLVLDKLGYSVIAVEPDPLHFGYLMQNLVKNNSMVKSVVRSAVGDKPGKAQFVRVLDNSTSSHLLGTKSNPYGPLQTFEVDVVDFQSLLEPTITTLAKLDIEGSEARVVSSLDMAFWNNLEVILEVSDSRSARVLFDYARHNQLKLYAQKYDWQKIDDFTQMPSSYKEGSLAISLEDYPQFGLG